MLKMELVLITLTAILCGILFMKLLYKLRSNLPWRVNCWFCNNNFWMKYLHRNCWTCPKCEQYNGFTKEGDYNKTLFNMSDQSIKAPRVFKRSPPRNGLCKMCNINQQLKVVQLANFVPMNENNFNEEVESYKAQLEKAYKLCSPCKKVLQMKLHKEKETLLGTKLLENRTPDKRSHKKDKQYQILKSAINNTSMFIAWILMLLVSVELYNNLTTYNNLPSTISNLKDVVLGLVDRIVSITKMKILLAFPDFQGYYSSFTKVLALEMVPKIFSYQEVEQNLTLIQKTSGGFVSLIQIIGHIWNVNKLKYSLIIDLLWSVFVMTSVMSYPETIDPTFISLVKLTSILAVLLVYKMIRNSKKAREAPKLMTTPKKMKNLTNGSINCLADEEDTISLDTDDDVSLSKFGLHNFSDSSHENTNPQTNNLINGRTFTPRSDSIWKKPQHNSTFCVNSVICKSPSSVSDSVFIKPSFNKYQKLSKDDSDSDLDESISSLCIGSPKKGKNGNSIFSLKKFNATPCFVAPTPLNRARPLISPSKLGHSTSWVAGGYWGSEGERQIFNIDGSRSSSQSSGFESQASSMNQRNLFSQPPSREESVCGEPMVVDNFRSCNPSTFSGHQMPQHFSRISSPVFPQMQYNSHVQIPQPRFVQQSMVAQNVFNRQQSYVQSYKQSDIFKIPGGSRLIKLPQVNSVSQ